MGSRGEDALNKVLELMEPDARKRATLREEGFWDLLEGEPPSTGVSQRLMLSGALPAVYERYWRPGWGRLFKGLTGPGMDEEVRIARLLLGLAEGHRVMDLACGPGNFTRSFARTVGAEGLAVGVDVSESMLAKAAGDSKRSAGDQLAYVRADATELPFSDAAFDGVCCFGALYLISDPAEAMAEMRRVLRPGGRVAIMTSVRRGITLSPLKPVIRLSSGLRLFEGDEITSELERLGFTEIHQRVSGMVQFVGGRVEQR
ncbi:MAG: methyltransferase domain-containing protein [Solirubrobacterales bacterium]